MAVKPKTTSRRKPMAGISRSLRAAGATTADAVKIIAEAKRQTRRTKPLPKPTPSTSKAKTVKGLVAETKARRAKRETVVMVPKRMGKSAMTAEAASKLTAKKMAKTLETATSNMVSSISATAAEMRRVQAQVRHDHDRDYETLLERVRTNAFLRTSNKEPVFETDVADLYKTYIRALPAEEQVHTCHACRRFFESYGNLAVVDTVTGSLTSIWWSLSKNCPAFYKPAMTALSKRFAKASIVRAFGTDEATMGTPKTGAYTHFGMPTPGHLLTKHRDLSREAYGNIMTERFNTVVTSLAEYPPALIVKAVEVVKTLERQAKFIEPLKWLLHMHAIENTNVLRREVVMAPEGFCHPKSGMVGSLLDDLKAGYEYATVQMRWARKVHPLSYQRPQAPPAAGNIATAERIIEKRGMGKSLERRFATVAEIPVKLWLPKESPFISTPETGMGSVFAHLRQDVTPAARESITLPYVTITWEKFARTVLPFADKMALYMPRAQKVPILALTTQRYSDAEPLLKWDDPNDRNPFAWYVYHGGSLPQDWRLREGSWIPVTSVIPLPPIWGSNPQTHLGEGSVLTLEGARDLKKAANMPTGNALFPEFLKSELHEVRATIEAYSKSACMYGQDEADAIGWDLRNPAPMATQLRVLKGTVWSHYTIDRWD